MVTLDAERYGLFNWQQGRIQDLDSPVLCAAIECWNHMRGLDFAPQWALSVLSDLPPPLLPFANVIDVSTAKPPFTYRFFGTGLARMHTFELTHKTTNSIEPEGFRNLCVDQHLLVIDQRQPLLFHNLIPAKVEGLSRPYTMVRFPLSDDGTEISGILTVEESQEDPDTTWELYR